VNGYLVGAAVADPWDRVCEWRRRLPRPARAPAYGRLRRLLAVSALSRFMPAKHPVESPLDQIEDRTTQVMDDPAGLALHRSATDDRAFACAPRAKRVENLTLSPLIRGDPRQALGPALAGPPRAQVCPYVAAPFFRRLAGRRCLIRWSFQTFWTIAPLRWLYPARPGGWPAPAFCASGR